MGNPKPDDRYKCRDMRISYMLALLIALPALMACVLQTPVAEEGNPTDTPPEQTAVSTAVAVGNSPVAPTLTQQATTTVVAAGGAVQRQFSSPPAMMLDEASDYVADFRTNYGNFRVELLASQTPITVNNFVFLARQGFYDGLTFHRVIDGFMVQGGDPTGTGGGHPGYRFGDEIVPGLAFDAPGKLAMANSGPGTNGSQFFITVAAADWLNGNHTIFGAVAEGQSVVDAISRVSTGARDVPLRPVVIERIDIIQSSR